LARSCRRTYRGGDLLNGASSTFDLLWGRHDADDSPRANVLERDGQLLLVREEDHGIMATHDIVIQEMDM
jgi:hypothetical protein